MTQYDKAVTDAVLGDIAPSPIDEALAALKEAREWLKTLEYALCTESISGVLLQDEFWRYLESIGLREEQQ